MKLPMMVSPATWDLIERLCPELGMAIDVFDASLAPLLPRADDEKTQALRALAGAASPAGERERLASAIATGRHCLFSSAGLRVGLFPIRHKREVAGLLAVAVMQRPGHLAESTGDAGDRGAPAPDSADHRIERIGWTLRAAIEADIALWEKLDEAGHRARWSDSLLRFLEYLQTCNEETELFAALVQAAAVWGDFEARVYRRTLDDRFVLDAALPVRDAQAGPDGFEASLLAGRATPIRVSSIAELEQMGWRAATGEVLLLPVGTIGQGEATASDARWLLALAGTADDRFASVFAMLARAAGQRLDQLETAHAERSVEALRARLASVAPGVPAAAAALLHEVARGLPCAHARLLVQDRASAPLRPLASVGGALFDAVLEPVAPGERRVDGQRLLLPLRIDPLTSAALDLWSPVGTPFSLREARVAERLAGWFEGWTSGAMRGMHAEPLLASRNEVSLFEQRLSDELERARRYGQSLGLLVIDIVPPARASQALVASITKVLRQQVRTTDLLGRLGDGRLGAVLVQGNDTVVRAVAARVQRHLDEVVTDFPDTAIRVGLAAFPGDAASVPSLLEAASR